MTKRGLLFRTLHDLYTVKSSSKTHKKYLDEILGSSSFLLSLQSLVLKEPLIYPRYRNIRCERSFDGKKDETERNPKFYLRMYFT